jgi:hypothetical protein
VTDGTPDPEHPAPPLSTPERTNFVEGQVLGAEDLRRDQEYHLGMRRLMNRFLHGQGVVSGLSVSSGDPPGTLVVEPGLAVDAWGRGIVVPAPTMVDLRERGSGSFTILLRYLETATEPVPTPEGERARVIAEGYEIVVASVASPTPPEPPVVLASVTVGEGRVDVDLATQRREMPNLRGLLDRVRALEERLGRRPTSPDDES